MNELRNTLNPELWQDREGALHIDIVRFSNVAVATAGQNEILRQYPDAIHLALCGPSCKDDSAANPHAKGLSSVTFEIHLFLAALTAQVGSAESW
jgi:hypothetical protein